MAKRRFKSQADIERFIEGGYGQGEGAHYKPWLRVQDVPSNGRSSKVPGLKTGRVHHLLSGLEYHYFLALEFSDHVIDIREQYPLLPLSETRGISRELEYEHPIYPGSNLPFVLTTDFLLTVQSSCGLRSVARTVKRLHDITEAPNRERALEKLEIEKVFWERKGVDWGIITDATITPVLASNLVFIREGASLDGALTQEVVVLKFLTALASDPDEQVTLATKMRGVAVRTGLSASEAIRVLKYCDLLPINQATRI